MNTEELYNQIKDRNAYELFKAMNLQLRTLPPNGATVHRLRGIQQGFSSWIMIYEKGIYSKEDNFEECLKRTKDSEQLLEAILLSIEKFQVII